MCVNQALAPISGAGNSGLSHQTSGCAGHDRRHSALVGARLVHPKLGAQSCGDRRATRGTRVPRAEAIYRRPRFLPRLTPISLHASTTSPPRPPDSGAPLMTTIDEMHWFAIQTRPNAEAAAEAQLRALPVETLLPFARRPVRHATRAPRMVLRPLFPGYLFARFCAAVSLRAVKYSRGVLRVLGSANDRPWPVDDADRRDHSDAPWRRRLSSN